jgi:hypothetical protein
MTLQLRTDCTVCDAISQCTLITADHCGGISLNQHFVFVLF